MKTAITAAVLAAALAGPANAKCGTNQLNGNWLMLYSDITVLKVAINNGLATIAPSGSFTIEQTSGCKVTVIVEGQTLRGSSESIAKSSSLRPRMIDAANSGGATISLIRR